MPPGSSDHFSRWRCALGACGQRHVRFLRRGAGGVATPAFGVLIARERGRLAKRNAAYQIFNVVKLVLARFKGQMSAVCRTSGCAGAPSDDALGFCHCCRGRYDQRRGVAALIGGRARRSHWRLFAALTAEQACALEQHAAGNAQLGRHGIGWAVGELLVEANEAGLRALADNQPASQQRERPSLRVIPGGRH